MQPKDQVIRRFFAFIRSGRVPSAQDRRDVAEIYRWLASRIRWTMRNVGAMDDQDVVQDILEKVLTKIASDPNWGDSIQSAAAFVVRTAHNRALDIVRNHAQSRQSTADLSAEEQIDLGADVSVNPTHQSAEQHSLMECVRKAVRWLVQRGVDQSSLADWLAYKSDQVSSAQLAEINGIGRHTQSQRLVALGKKVDSAVRRICPEHWRDYNQRAREQRVHE